MSPKFARKVAFCLRRATGRLTVLALAAATLSAVGIGGGTAHADPSTPPASSPPASGAPDPASASASAQAAASGQPVEVTDATTETTQVMANPDGSFTLTSDRDPVRVQQDGHWTPIDTSLAANPDASLSPRASTAQLTFSGGGTGPALSIADPDTGNAIAFSWPTALPAPRLDGDTATYSEVLPGVDLKLTAKAASYSEVLVVKDATAAANPALDQLKLHASASGLKLAKAANGGLQATDNSGAVVFDGAAPTMWDSTIDSHVGPTPSADDPGSARVTALPVSVPAADGTTTDASTTVTLAPPAAALEGPDVHYPVFIDPALSTPNHTHFAVVLSSGAPYFDDPGQDMKVGYCDWANCKGIGVGRSYFSFNTADITRHAAYQNTTAHIFAAKVSARETHNAMGCTSEPVNLWTAAGISGSTVWPGPAISMLQQVSSNRSDDCASAQPAMIDFDGASVLARLQSAANSDTTVLTFGLLAPDESNRNYWKRFASDPVLTVTYNFPPSAPLATGINTARSSVVNCNGSIITSDSSPSLLGLAHDNNSPHTPLDFRFNIYPVSGSTPVASSSDVLGARTNGGTGDDYSTWWDSSAALPDGAWKYTVSAHFASANFYIDMSTGASGPYPFIVEHNPPATSPIIASADYPKDFWGSAVSHPGLFSLTTNGGSTAIGLSYAFDTDPTIPTTCTTVAGKWVLTPAGTAQLAAPMLPPGPHTLKVASFDGAHDLSAPTSYRFFVSPNAGTTGVNRVEAEDPSLAWGGTGPSQTMTDLFRYTNGSDHASAVGGIAPAAGYLFETGLGQLSTTAVPGTTALYDCLNGTEHFSTPSPTCEGKTMFGTGPLGYIYTSPTTSPPTHPIYRCRTAEHFDSLLSNCEGQIYENILGYAMDLPASGAPSTNHSSSGYGMRFIPTTAAGQTFTASFTPPVTADYAFGGQFYTSPANGKVKFSISDSSTPPNTIALGTDGTPNAAADTYSSAAGEKYIQLGGAQIQAGKTYTITGTIDSAGTGGGFQTALDYLTIAPVNNFAAIPNNHGIATDNTATTADLTGSHQALSATALAAAGIQPGGTYTTGGATFHIPSSAPDGSDNILTVGTGSVLPLDQAVTGATTLNLLVANTGPLTPADNAGYFVTTVDDTDIKVDHQLPAIPAWMTADTTTVTSSGVAGGTRTLATDLPYYDDGVNATPTATHVYLYLISIPISSTHTLTEIDLPTDTLSHDPNIYRLHILAVATS